MPGPSREQLALQEALPAYEVRGEIGRGAFGVVYAARHAQLGREVAIKQLPRAFAADPAVRERFVAEAKTVAALHHPHIVPVYDFLDRDDGICLLVMERCQGALSDRFQRDGLATDEACAAVLACCAALEFAHESGLLHRDIKPENLLYDARGVLKLGDFGIARALNTDARRTATGTIIGTPAYMSPEQVRGDTLSPASDVYSVGIMAYELLTGRLPFPGSSTATGLLAHHLVTAPTPLITSRPELPPAIGAIVDGALVKDTADRFATALDFATALTRACVASFGTGWLRRRRFVLHWPAIIAEAERPMESAPRTGTIIVKADPHREQIVGGAALPPPNALTAPPSAPASPPPVAGGTSPSPPPTTPAPEPATRRPQRTRRALVAAALAAVVGGGVAGFVVLRADDSAETASGSTQPVTSQPVTSQPDTSQPVTSQPVTNQPDTSQPENTDPAVTTPATETPVTGSPATAAPPTGVDTTVQESTTVPPSVTASTGVALISTRPPDLDMSVADSPWTPTPCPEGLERVACIFGGVAIDPETGELTVPYFTEGYVPELEPADYHMHFYLDSAVHGDEGKAGTDVPGGSWRLWDAPFPFTSFGGENGRTGFTLADIEAAGARRLCVLVSLAHHSVVPDTGNCAPIPQTFDPDLLREQVDRIEGTYVGRCAIGATLIIPDGWRAVDLVGTPVAEAAVIIRPTAAAKIQPELEELIAAGGVLWADGPAADGSTIELHVVTVPGEFTAADPPDVVQSTLARLGVETADTTTARLMGRDVLMRTTHVRGTKQAISYVIPDHGYAIAITAVGEPTETWHPTAAAIAATVNGC